MRLLILTVALVAACDKPPVEWSEPAPIAEVGSVSRLVVDSSGQARFVADSSQPANQPSDTGLCSASLRTAFGKARMFAAWWRVRPDSSSVLLLSSSADSGKSWGTPLPVDTTDVSSVGCRRPPPSLATVADDAYLAYSMIAPEGTGVFFAHSMGSMIHEPVPVIYGERLVSTAIAADGNHVVVAYEEPNGARPQVDMALSSSQGHLFDWRTVVSKSIDNAGVPVAALNQRAIAVGWRTRRSTDSVLSRVVRVGRIR